MARDMAAGNAADFKQIGNMVVDTAGGQYQFYDAQGAKVDRPVAQSSDTNIYDVGNGNYFVPGTGGNAGRLTTDPTTAAGHAGATVLGDLSGVFSPETIGSTNTASNSTSSNPPTGSVNTVTGSVTSEVKLSGPIGRFSAPKRSTNYYVGEGSTDKGHVYVNFTEGRNGANDELYVNQGPNNSVKVVGYNPATKGNDGDGGLVLPDGGVAVKHNGSGYVISGGVVTSLNPEAPSMSASDLIASVPAGHWGFSDLDNKGIPGADQLNTMAAYSISVNGYGGATATSSGSGGTVSAATLQPVDTITDAKSSNKKANDVWDGVGGENGTAQVYVNFDTHRDAVNKGTMYVTNGNGYKFTVSTPSGSTWDPNTQGSASNGSVFLPDGSMAVKINGAAWIVADGFATQVGDNTKTMTADAFWQQNSQAKPTASSSNYGYVVSSGQGGTLTAQQQAAMKSYGVDPNGLVSNAAATPSSVTNVGKSGDNAYVAVGDGTNGMTYAMYDAKTNKLFASKSTNPKNAIHVVGYNPATKSDKDGALFLPDGSVAIKHDGHAYVDTQGTVVCVDDSTQKPQSESSFFASPVGTGSVPVPTSQYSGFTDGNGSGQPTAAQQAAMQRFNVSINSATPSGSSASSLSWTSHPTLSSSGAVPGGGVYTVSSGDPDYDTLQNLPGVQGILKDNAALAMTPQQKAQMMNHHGDLPLTISTASPTLSNEGWQAYDIPGAHTEVIYNPTPGVHQPMHAIDTQTGKEISLPDFMFAYGPSGSIVFSDGTRIDVKGGGAGGKGSSLNFVSGDQLTTVSGSSPAVTSTSASDVKNYLAGTHMNPFNTAVEISGSGGTPEFAYTNNRQRNGLQAWGIAGDGSYGGETHEELNWLNDPASKNNPAVTAALYPGQGYAPTGRAGASTGWTDEQIGTPPLTKSEVNDNIKDAVLSVLFSGIPGLDVADWIGTGIGLGVKFLRGIGLEAKAASMSPDKMSFVGDSEGKALDGSAVEKAGGTSAPDATTVSPKPVEPTPDPATVGGKSVYPTDGVPNSVDVVQGNQGDCWLLSNLTARANTDPKSLMDNLKVNNDGTVTVSGLHDPNNPTGAALSYTFNIDQEAQSLGLNLANGQAQWVRAYEVATALTLRDHPYTANGRVYDKSTFDNGAPPEVAERVFGNANAMTFAIGSTPDETSLMGVLGQVNQGKRIETWTKGTLPQWAKDQNLVGNHAYTVIGTRDDGLYSEVELSNPHQGGQPIWVTYDDYVAAFGYYTVS